MVNVKNADLVICATGYQTNNIPIRDFDGQTIDLLQKVPNTQYEVDSNCRLISVNDYILAKTFGQGLAYPQRTNDGKTKIEVFTKNPRADSFTMYLNIVSKKLLENFLPKSKLDSKINKIYKRNVLENLKFQKIN